MQPQQVSLGEAQSRGKVVFRRDLRTGKMLSTDRRGLDDALADSTVNTGIRQGGSSPDANKVEIAYVGFGTMLNNRLTTGGDSIYQKIATVAQTDKLLNREIWLNALPTMRMWEGPKVVDEISAENLPIVTRPHEASISIPKGDLLNDMLSLYAPKITGLADAYGNALDDLAVTMLAAGIQGTALGATYDGQNLIDTDHTFRSADVGIAAQQYSNKVTGAFSAAVFQTAINLFLGLKNEKGIPINTKWAAKSGMMLLHGPANRILVRNVLVQDIGAGLVQNLDAGTAIPVLCPWISARTTKVLGVPVTLTGLEWFLMPAASTAVIIQIKRGVEFLSVEEGYTPFSTGKFFYGIEAEFGAAYGLPQEIVGGPGS